MGQHVGVLHPPMFVLLMLHGIASLYVMCCLATTMHMLHTGKSMSMQHPQLENLSLPKVTMNGQLTYTS